MLATTRRHKLIGTNASRTMTSLLSPRLAIVIDSMSGIPYFDTSVLGVPDQWYRHNLHLRLDVVLSGRITETAPSGPRSLGPGDVVQRRVTRHREERWHGPLRVLTLYAHGSPSTPQDSLVCTLSPWATKTLCRIADDLEGGCVRGTSAVAAAHAIFAGLETAALMTGHFAVGSPAPPLVQAYGEALALALCNPGGSAFSDVARLVGHSERQARRTVRTLMEWLGPLVGDLGWHRRLRTERTATAAAFLMHPRVTIEHVASSVGYGSARALLLAMKGERIAPPRRWRHVDLGDIRLVPPGDYEGHRERKGRDANSPSSRTRCGLVLNTLTS